MHMDQPATDLLICAYLGRKFKERSDSGISYETQARQMRIANKQTLIKLARGGTVGLGQLWQMAKALTENSMDALAAQARVWWSGLPDAEKAHLSNWAATKTSREARTLAVEGASNGALQFHSRAGRLSEGAVGERLSKEVATVAEREGHGKAPSQRASTSRVKRAGPKSR